MYSLKTLIILNISMLTHKNVYRTYIFTVTIHILLFINKMNNFLMIFVNDLYKVI
jgi:hypothetical protein